MASRDRYTFSQVVSSLIGLESKLTEFYRASAERAERSESRNLFLAFSRENLKRIDSLSKVGRETVIEMSLEPITGLNLEEYQLRIDHLTEDKSMNDVQKAIALEGIVQELYGKVSTKVVYVSADSSDLFDRFSQENFKRKHLLTLK